MNYLPAHQRCALKPTSMRFILSSTEPLRLERGTQHVDAVECGIACNPCLIALKRAPTPYSVTGVVMRPPAARKRFILIARLCFRRLYARGLVRWSVVHDSSL